MGAPTCGPVRSDRAGNASPIPHVHRRGIMLMAPEDKCHGNGGPGGEVGTGSLSQDLMPSAVRTTV